jgi:ribosomal protein S12 methylthiotransferase
LTDELIDLIAGEEKICSYVDLPLQHIDDDILKKMRRKGDSRLIRSLLEKLGSRIPHLAMRTTFIVGFPGETEAQFNKLLDFVGDGWFNRIGVFGYSHEEGTPAYEFSDSVSQEEKNERRNRLMAAQEEIALSKNQALIGTIQEVMVEGRDEETQEFFGRLEGQAPEIDGMVTLEGKAEAGEFVKAEITGATELDLSGRILKT